MTVEELESHPLFKALSLPLQRFVKTYCVTKGDSEAAAISAFPDVTSKKLVRKYAKDAIEHEAVSRLIVIWNGMEDEEPSLEEFRKVLWKWTRTPDKNLNKAAIADLLADVSGWKKSRLAPGVMPTESFIDKLEGK